MLCTKHKLLSKPWFGTNKAEVLQTVRTVNKNINYCNEEINYFLIVTIIHFNTIIVEVVELS